MQNDKHVAGTPLVIAIGDGERREFAGTMRWLSARSRLESFSTTEHCLQYLRSAPAGPALIVWLQSYLGQYGEVDLAKIRAVEPRANMVCVYGAISEGELRTGKPLPGITRIPWYAWEARLLPTWPACAVTPANELRSSRLELTSAPRPHPADRTGEQLLAAIIGVGSACKEMARLIIAACETAGHVARWINRAGASPAPVDVAIWDDSSDARHAVIPIESFASDIAPAPIIATMSFPRIDDLARLSQCGVQFVLGKPLMIEDLLWQIEALIKTRQSASANGHRFR
jgi:hypothetical protein